MYLKHTNGMLVHQASADGSPGRRTVEVAVIGAGSSGLAVMKAVRELGVTVECFERGSDVGGLWRYENDNGLSSAYGSLRTNVSSARMGYPSFPLPKSYGDFPHHTEMAKYLSAYADNFGLREHIHFRTTVERVEPDHKGGWCLSFDDGSVRRFDAAVAAVGHGWYPKLPAYAGVFAARTSHSHDYRTPEPFAGRRVLVVGGGQSAAEIAAEVAGAAERTCISLRAGAHVIPRWVSGRPYDASDRAPLNRMPWRLMNLRYAGSVARELGPLPAPWPLPSHRLLEGIPIISSDLIPAVRRGAVVARPAVERLVGDRVRFEDGTEEQFDDIIYATGYRISLPFLAPDLVSVNGREVPLYRRIVPPAAPAGLFLAGCIDAPGGLLPLVEAQGDWIAAVLSGRLVLPPTEQMWQAINRAERRTRQRFPEENPRSIRCDPHAYRRLLRGDLRQLRLRTLRRRLQPTFGVLPRRRSVRPLVRGEEAR
jgi:dimethylaniline monooxygenase (N-oxide forming)